MTTTEIEQAALALIAAVPRNMPPTYTSKIETAGIAITVERRWWKTKVVVRRMIAQFV